MKRFPLYVFGGLVVASIAAFFVTQHLKVTTPLVGGLPKPVPGWISPIDGGVCNGVAHRSTHMSFYLFNRADDVNVYVVDDEGTIVQTVASGHHMARKVRSDFVWNGREADGALAPDGTYHFRVALISEGRAVIVGGPIHIRTTPPRPVVTSVSPNLIPAGSTPVTIRFHGNEDFRSQVQIYRTDVPGPPRLVDSFETKRHPKQATWDGTIAGVPAPAGTYLIGLQTVDLACNTGRFPIVLPPTAGSTPHAGVTVRYLAAQPSLDPVAAGTLAIVDVDSRTRPYAWTLGQYGARKSLSKGRGRGPGTPLAIKLPPKRPGLYVLALTSGPYRTAAPLVASAPRSAARRRILVVLPALTWQGENPVDDDGDGLVNTLAAGLPIRLDRPFAAGLPAGLGDEAALLAYLDKAHLGYDLTTDIALIGGVGPPLTAYKAVVFAGSERWLPASFTASLQSYVQHGGHVLSLGLDSLRGRAPIQNTSQGPEALAPTPPSATDALSAHPASALVHTSALITVITDGLGIFSGTSLAFPGFGSYEPVVPPSQPASAAGPTTASLSIVGYHLGSGIVVEVGLVGFGSSLRRDVDAQEFVNRLWQVLGR